LLQEAFVGPTGFTHDQGLNVVGVTGLSQLTRAVLSQFFTNRGHQPQGTVQRNAGILEVNHGPDAGHQP